MPYFKCVACKASLYSAAGPVDVIGDLCPDCGFLLEPQASVAESRLGARRWIDDDGVAPDAGPPVV
jgi:hypothetical protein